MSTNVPYKLCVAGESTEACSPCALLCRISSPSAFPYIMLYFDLWRGFMSANFLRYFTWGYWWTCFPPIIHDKGIIVALVLCNYFMEKLTYIVLVRSCAVDAGGRDFIPRQLARGMQVLPVFLHVSSFDFVSSSLMYKFLHFRGPNILASEKDRICKYFILW